MSKNGDPSPKSLFNTSTDPFDFEQISNLVSMAKMITILYNYPPIKIN